jgi:hypothetical protein
MSASPSLFNGYPGGKKPVSVIVKEKLKHGAFGALMGGSVGGAMGVVHTLMMRPPPGQRMELLKANCGRTAGFMCVLFGIGSMFRS